MAKYKVRDGFNVIDKENRLLGSGGDSVDLGAKDTLDNAHKLEGITEDVLDDLRGEVAGTKVKGKKAEEKADK